jgi:N-acetylglucosaminyldiphosphoundecaprenol N-acetyl-beta-D-mannosaminyltransferase
LNIVLPRQNLLGVQISAINMDQALAAIESWIRDREPQYVCVTPAHSVMACYDHPELRAIYNASGLTTPDGMAIVWWLRWQKQKHVSRVYGPDLMLAVCQRSLAAGFKHFLYGGALGVGQDLAGCLKERYPGLQVAGVYSPPFRPLTPEEDRLASEMIIRSGADIVWVGIGSPRQEQWMSSHVGKVGAPVLVGVGAAFDFLSGRKRQAPRWVQRGGLEWLFRLFTEPGRLWRRYVLGYPRFVVLVLLQQFGLIRFK